MILPFSTLINGKPNYFVENIWSGLIDNVFEGDQEHIEYWDKHIARFGNSWEEFPTDERKEYYKIHTIREDKNKRWAAGCDIHFIINNRRKSSFQFAPVLPCISTQEILMTAFHNAGMDIYIDGVKLTKRQKQILAKQDGFENFNAFEAYFTTALQEKPHFTARFKLIHWTNFKY